LIRLFNVYCPIRTLILLVGEAVVVWTSFLLGALLAVRQDSSLVLSGQHGYFKLLAVTVSALLCCHWFDLYDPARFGPKGELYFRLLQVSGLLAFALAVVSYVFPRALIGNGSSLLGLMILTLALFLWRVAYGWLFQRSYLLECVYVLGTGDRALRLVKGLRQRPELGVEVVGWTGHLQGALNRESIASHLMELAGEGRVHRVIVAMPDRRGMIPMPELLQLRLQGISVEEATSWLERISGRIEVEQLYPSWLIFKKGFRSGTTFTFVNRLLSILVSLICLLLLLPIIPFVLLAIKLDSPGPVLYRQERVGRGGVIFHCYKFRTMRQDAEADTGPVWAGDDDPRITRAGRFLRASRIDEIPQLWCVLKGDMAFVGPRPERPEFVKWLSEEIPYYGVRHAVRPGITGWAQIRYKYGNTIEDAKEKLQYDLFYIKNASFGLDLLIMFQTIKIVLLGRGAR
jgi:sugar transferase (PEP-CTERM system associated)